MICPNCMSDYTDVYNSRPSHAASQVWRRRRCAECNQSFTTYEKIDLKYLKINGKGYRRAILYHSIYDALTAEGDSGMRYVDDCVDTVEIRLMRLPRPQLSSTDVIRAVLATLSPLSNAAYLRYLSTYAPTSKVALEAALKAI